MQYFYFTRTSPAPASGKYLVSGIVEAADEEAAIAALGAALRKAKRRDDAQNFAFRALARMSRANADGILAITTAEEMP